MKWRLLRGDVRETLRDLPDGSVQTCVTSPPYWGLRDYGADGQIGLERTPDAYVEQMVNVFREVRRVLKDDGTLWLNLGDSYAATSKGDTRTAEELAAKSGLKRNITDEARRVELCATNKQWRSSGRYALDIGGLKPKDLCGIPWRVAFALQADGWYLRSDIIWSKPNPMPESVTDRPTKAHEYIFLLAKSQRYFYDAEAIAEVAISGTDLGILRGRMLTDGAKVAWHAPSIAKRQAEGIDSRTAGDGSRNCRSVWTIATQPYPDAHFATFPEALPEKCIKAGSRIGDVVLDPFAGSGTTGRVALRLGREFVGCELNPEYVELARKRISGAAPLFTEEQTA